MKLLGFTYLAILLGVSSATGPLEMQINYYSDSGCSDYIGQVDVTWASDADAYYPTSNCYNYHYGNSVNIAECYVDRCACALYRQEKCQGNVIAKIFAGGGYPASCGANSSTYHSFFCEYRID